MIGSLGGISDWRQMRYDGAGQGHIYFQPRHLIDDHRGQNDAWLRMARRDQGDSVGKEEFKEGEDSASPGLHVRSGWSVAARLVASTLKHSPECVGCDGGYLWAISPSEWLTESSSS